MVTHYWQTGLPPRLVTSGLTTLILPSMDSSLLITSATELISLIVNLALLYPAAAFAPKIKVLNSNANVRKVLTQLINGTFNDDTEIFRDLYDSLINSFPR